MRSSRSNRPGPPCTCDSIATADGPVENSPASEPGSGKVCVVGPWDSNAQTPETSSNALIKVGDGAIPLGFVSAGSRTFVESPSHSSPDSSPHVSFHPLSEQPPA